MVIQTTVIALICVYFFSESEEGTIIDQISAAKSKKDKTHKPFWEI